MSSLPTRTIRNQELADKAKEHIKFLNENYKQATDTAVSNSKIYDENHTFKKREQQSELNIKIADEDTITTGLRLSEDNEKTAVLNFASSFWPGGSFEYGAIAQEEAICHESNLFPILSDNRFKDFYKKNGEDTNNSMYYNRGIYTENVTVIKDKLEIGKLDVITVAAPAPRFSNNHRKREQALPYLKSRIEFVLDIAEDNNIQNLVLGAFGCGAFGNSTEDVATIFKEELKNRNFKNVVFAIIDYNSNNKEIFEQIFK